MELQWTVGEEEASKGVSRSPQAVDGGCTISGGGVVALDERLVGVRGGYVEFVCRRRRSHEWTCSGWGDGGLRVNRT